MAMSIGPAESAEDEAISTINTTPLVDVMLVLLIIFLITIPVVTQSINLQVAIGIKRSAANQAGKHRDCGHQGRRCLLEHAARSRQRRSGQPAEEDRRFDTAA